MADTTMHVTMTCDTSKIEQAILKLKAGLDVRTKCAIADCPHPSKETNRIIAMIDTSGPPFVHVYTCDKHFEEYSYLNEEHSR